MAGTAVLRSQNCRLRPNTRFHYEPLPSPPLNPHPNRYSNSQSKMARHRKRSPVGPPFRNQGQNRTQAARFPSKDLVMGQVKILKRGEELREKKNKNGRGFDEAVLAVCSTDRLGPEPETVQKQIRFSDLKLYAGSTACLASPPPSSLPFPAFFAKKTEQGDVASSDLRRLLRLDVL